jgi:hypothetical protein
MEVQRVRQDRSDVDARETGDRVPPEARRQVVFLWRRPRRQGEASRSCERAQHGDAQEGHDRGAEGQGGQEEEAYQSRKGEAKGRKEE